MDQDDYLKLNNIACELRTRAERAEAELARVEGERDKGCFFCRDCDAVRCDTEIMSKLRKIAEQAGKRQWWNVMVYIIELNGVALAAMHTAVNATDEAGALKGVE